jgi:nitrogen fixation protein FixH
MKFNWGTGIALFYSIFMLTMVATAVVASRNHDPGLVAKNYYDLDLNYQAHLEKKQNTATLAALPKVRHDASLNAISIQFPSEMKAIGTAKLYRSATTKDDFSAKIENTNALEIPAANLASGRWHVELDWEANGKKYFWETAIFVASH